MKNEQQLLAPEKIIVITQRKCSDKVQPSVKIGKRYSVVRVDVLKGGVPVAVVGNPDKKGTTMRINASRFDWKVTSFEQIKLKQDEIVDMASGELYKQYLKSSMSEEETATVVYVPHIVEIMAVASLAKCVSICKENQYSEYKEVSRAVKELEKSNYYEQIAEIKIEVYKLMEKACFYFKKENARVIKNLEGTVEKELTRAYPQALPECARKNSLRITAIFGIILLRLMKKCYLEHENDVARDLGWKLYQLNNRTYKIEKYLKEYAGNIDKFNFDRTAIQNAVKVLKKKLTSVKFNIVKDS